MNFACMAGRHKGISNISAMALQIQNCGPVGRDQKRDGFPPKQEAPSTCRGLVVCLKQSK